MAAYGLTREELMYELKLRGNTNLDSMTIRQLRETLTSLVACDINLDFPGVILDITSEIEICEAKISELSSRISVFEGSIQSALYDELDHRVLHLLNRVRRLVARATPDKEAQLQDMLTTVIALDEQLNRNCTPAATFCLTPVASPTVPMLDSDSVSSKSLVSVSKWGLKFSGDEPQQSVADMLERVEELRVARGVSKSDLFRAATDILEGSALCWFRAVRHTISSWDQLASRLREEFQPMGYEDELWNEIMHRIQGSDERVTIYVACMTNLFARLPTPIPEVRRLHIIRRNLSPYFLEHLGTVEIHSVDELTRVCKQLEENRHQAARNASIRPATERPLEPTYAYRPPTASNSSYSGNRGSRTSTAAVSSLARCWNCGDSGHMFRKCGKERTRFCFRCGKQDVTAATCSRCSSSGNARSDE